MDKIAKQRLNVFMLVDCSTSMRGERIKQVNDAIRDIKSHLVKMQDENSKVDFYLTVITYSTEAFLLNDDKMKAIEDFDFKDIKAGGWSNLHLAYVKLADLLKKESKGGVMPDFGGIAPIILLLTDGHPTKWPMNEELHALERLPWFREALKYGISIMLNDKRTNDVLKAFVKDKGDVIDCYDSKMLERMIKIIVLTASKVKSTTTNISAGKPQDLVAQIRQEVKQAISEVDDWEW